MKTCMCSCAHLKWSSLNFEIHIVRIRPRPSSSVSLWLPKAAVRVRAQVWSSAIMVDKETLEEVFSDYFGFPYQTLLHKILHPHIHPGQEK
jgi:hypothetical protein